MKLLTHYRGCRYGDNAIVSVLVSVSVPQSTLGIFDTLVACDVDRDGLDDLIVSSSYVGSGGSIQGADSYLVYGRNTGNSFVFSRLTSPWPTSLLVMSLQSTDINGDGVCDCKYVFLSEERIFLIHDGIVVFATKIRLSGIENVPNVYFSLGDGKGNFSSPSKVAAVPLFQSMYECCQWQSLTIIV